MSSTDLENISCLSKTYVRPLLYCLTGDSPPSDEDCISSLSGLTHKLAPCLAPGVNTDHAKVLTDLGARNDLVAAIWSLLSIAGTWQRPDYKVATGFEQTLFKLSIAGRPHPRTSITHQRGFRFLFGRLFWALFHVHGESVRREAVDLFTQDKGTPRTGMVSEIKARVTQARRQIVKDICSRAGEVPWLRPRDIVFGFFFDHAGGVVGKLGGPGCRLLSLSAVGDKYFIELNQSFMTALPIDTWLPDLLSKGVRGRPRRHTTAKFRFHFLDWLGSAWIEVLTGNCKFSVVKSEIEELVDIAGHNGAHLFGRSAVTKHANQRLIGLLNGLRRVPGHDVLPGSPDYKIWTDVADNSPKPMRFLTDDQLDVIYAVRVQIGAAVVGKLQEGALSALAVGRQCGIPEIYLQDALAFPV